MEEKDEKREDERWCGEVGEGRGIGGRGRGERPAAYPRSPEAISDKHLESLRGRGGGVSSTA